MNDCRTKGYELVLYFSNQTWWLTCPTFNLKNYLHQTPCLDMNQTSILWYLIKWNRDTYLENFLQGWNLEFTSIKFEIAYNKSFINPTHLGIVYSIWLSFLNLTPPQKGGKCFCYTHWKPTNFDCKVNWSCCFGMMVFTNKFCM
jgi:hypothetical protein